MPRSVSVYYFSANNDDDEEEPTMKERVLAYVLKLIDIFCVWDCCWLWLQIQKYVALIVFDPFVELFITLCIVVNTLFMALDHHNMDKDLEKALKSGNYVRRHRFFFGQQNFIFGLFVVFYSNFFDRSFNEASCNESKILFSRRLEYF